ncbi:PTS sugar transporter subunit IIA [Desulfobulbus rhabdoformis]|uniref:PTS sugar transporter subunit IIA n=1 Tax=Desulfobulbus rhabdoformis TaxID=34032 RepID=UPI001965C5D5|nr:PTS sugar transporter subunit IIA [Desulfobulbus rhabdoformis]MBM9613678.1 PTS sugar transporter subunit IIA [Desulfobulbus rhabdoformis]
MPQLNSDAIILDMKATTKDGALRELAGLAATQCGRFTEEVLYQILLEREAVGSTGVGNGVAIPHGKIEGLDQILLCFGRSRAGIDFNAIDKRDAYLFMLMISPAGKGGEYLQTLARVSRILKKSRNRQLLFDYPTREEIVTLFASEDNASK